ncbi:Endonuclease/exonuclease/phosphatase, partial [Armillaria luteobubalina]
KNTKATMNIGSLNIRGYGSANLKDKESRWMHLNQIMREEKIGVLAIQETHLNDERRETIEKIFPKLRVMISEDPEQPTAKAGIALILNRHLTNWDSVEKRVIVPGRAMMVRIKWHRERKLTILCVYAPNVTEHQGGENATFWNDIETHIQAHPDMKPDVIIGDFNMVEEPINRLPLRNDPADAREALDDMKMSLGMSDGWRNMYPTKRSFTFLQNGT